jgi:hypothetical protein
MSRTKLIALTLVLFAVAIGSRLVVSAYAVITAWPTPSAVFYINPNNLDVTANAAEAALQSAMNVWNTQGGSAFRFTYGGRVSDTNTAQDGRNVIIFRNASGGGAVASTYLWSSNGVLVDADTVFWDGDYTFFTGTSGCSNGLYIEDVGTHELGHALGLDHSSDLTATMYPSSQWCSQDLRTLSSDDIAGVRALYPSSGSNTPPTVTIASPANGASFVQGAGITFTGAASDQEDGTLTSRMTWASSIDGTLGSGSGFSRVLSAGNHVITASVTDNRGSTSSRQVTIAVTPPAPPPVITSGSSATFIGVDTATQGNWKGTYGSGGYTVAADGTSLPSYATITHVGSAVYTWDASPSDVRALQRTATGRIASTWYGGTIALDMTLADGAAHNVAVYFVDYDRGGRSALIQVVDPVTNAVLDTRTIAGFTGGQYLRWSVSGHVAIRVVNTGSGNAVYSGVFLETSGSSSSEPPPSSPPPQSPPPPSSVSGTAASFIGADTTTQGNWKGRYGSSGYTVAADGTSLPSYATIAHVGSAVYTWDASPSDVRALQRTGTGRIASTWYGGTIDLDMTLTDGIAHDVSVYFVDYDHGGRSALIQVVDAATGAVLDTRTIAGFTGGQYLRWSVAGHVVIRLTNTGSGNAVYSGVFLDTSGVSSSPAPPSPSQAAGTAASFIGVDATTQGNWKGTYGSSGYTVAEDGTSLPAYATIAHVGSAVYTWDAWPSDVRALQRTSTSGRIASTWYGGTIALDVTVTDGASHDLSMYFVDYDHGGRSAQIQVIDAATNAVLDTRTITGFLGGQYLRWSVSGHVVIRVVNTGSGNAVYSGVFFDR